MILICIPTVSGREQYLVNAIRGYAERTEGIEWRCSLIRDAPSAGVGWNRCAAHGLKFYPGVKYLHFSNDDVVPAPRWWEPLVEAADQGAMPCPRIEPAGGHIRDQQIFQTHPPMPPDYFPVPRDPVAYFYADVAEKQPLVDWQEIDHGNLPFLSVEMWQELGPFPPIHYGTDRYIYEMARRRDHRIVARQESVFYNYNANIGRSKGDWSEQDFLDYDGMFALPAYLSGRLKATEEDSRRLTQEGLALARDWRRRSFG